MPDKPKGLSHLWKELKRRRVVHVITVYASASFVLIELVNNLTEPLNLPLKLATIMVVILAVGFPLAIILAWIYDLTPKGIEKTKGVEEIEGSEKSKVPNAWRIATFVSFVVIAGLLTLNIVSGSKQLQGGDIQSLVILPFDNFTGDDQLENMVAGMHSILVGDMGRVSGLRVIGTTSSRLYKKVEMSAGDIASELNVDAVVEATVMCLGDTICMQFRLVSTTGKEEQLWVGEYREDKSQILNLYNRVTKQIAEEVRIKLTENEEKILTRDRAADRDAIDAFIRSYAYWGDLGKEALDKAYEFLSLALEKDSEWAPIHAAMAIVWGGRMQMGMVEPEIGRKLIIESIERARELDADFADSHFINGIIFTWTEWDWENGERELLQALAMNPNHVMARMYYAHLLMSLQRMDEALVQGELALNLDPRNPTVLALYSIVLKGAGQHQAAMEYIEKGLAIDPDHSFTQGQVGRALYNTGQYEKELEMRASQLVEKLGKNKVPDLDSIYRAHGRLTAYQELARLHESYAEELGYSQNHRYIGMAVDYYRADAYSKALDELQKALEIRNPNMPYIGTGTRFEALHDSTRFLVILDSMNLPHPKKQ